MGIFSLITKENYTKNLQLQNRYTKFQYRFIIKYLIIFYQFLQNMVVLQLYHFETPVPVHSRKLRNTQPGQMGDRLAIPSAISFDVRDV